MRAFVLVALALLLHACAARTAPPTPPPPQQLDAVAVLRGDLRNLFEAPEIGHALWAVSVRSLRANDEIFALNPSRLMIPASAQKLLTTAAAAERLGWDFRFSTRLLATGSITDGTLTGDLVIAGTGDPTINPRHPERWRAFDDWAATLRAKGIKIISGHVIGDDNIFEEPGWGMGWSWEDLTYGFGAPVGGLQYNENQIELTVAPGVQPGARAIVMQSPIGSGLLIDNRVTTVDTEAGTAIQISRVPGTTVLEIRGEIALDARPVSMTAAVENPTRFFLNGFREALGRHGIFVGGSTLDVDELHAPPALDNATELIADRSPPLAEIIDVTNKWSRNLYAETLLLAMSHLPTDGALSASNRATISPLQDTLSSLGVPAESYVARDGSGLSRYDYVAADALTTLLSSIARNARHAEAFRSTLPVAGVTGTLANRLKGTVAESRVWAKTGSMSSVRALAGYLTTVVGEPIVFAIITNNYRIPSSEVDAVFDKAVLRLVEFRR